MELALPVGAPQEIKAQKPALFGFFSVRPASKKVKREGLEVSEPSRLLVSGVADWCMAMMEIDGDSMPGCEQKCSLCTVVHQ